MENYLNGTIKKNVYNYHHRLMVSWLGTYSYFNNEPIKIGDIEIMTAAYSSSG